MALGKFIRLDASRAAPIPGGAETTHLILWAILWQSSAWVSPALPRLPAQNLDVENDADGSRLGRMSGSLDSITFRHAWKNGRWHAYQPVSLDLADSDDIMDKTRRLLGHLTAVQDGAADLPLLHLILGSPSDPSLQQTYRKAIALLKNSAFNPEVIEEDVIDTLVSRIEAELLAHDCEALAAGTSLRKQGIRI